MKSFKIAMLLVMLTCSVSMAQTIGDPLNYVKQERPGGEFKAGTDSGVYFYDYRDDASVWIYKFDVNLICTHIFVTPLDASDINIMIKSLNRQGYIQIDDRHWKYYRGDGSILSVILEYPKDLGPVLVISELK